jgi:hypothetical protein
MQPSTLYLIPIYFNKFDHGNTIRFQQILSHINSKSNNVTILIWNRLFEEEDFKNLRNLLLDFCKNLIMVYGKDLDQVASNFELFDFDFEDDSLIFKEWCESRIRLVGDRGVEIEKRFISPKIIGILHNLNKNNLVTDVFTNYFFTGGLLDIFGRKVKKTIDVHDVFSRKSRVFYIINENSLIKNIEITSMPGHTNHFVTSMDLEAAFLDSADELISISKTEFNILSIYLPGKSNVLMPYVSSASRDLVNFKYSGLLNFIIIMSDNFFNRKDLIFFLKNVWSYVENRQAKLYLIGGITKFAGELPFENVYNCGTYEDDSELESMLLNLNIDALLFVNRLGSGQKVKNSHFNYLRLPKIFYSSSFVDEVILDNLSLVCDTRNEIIDLLSIGKIST